MSRAPFRLQLFAVLALAVLVAAPSAVALCGVLTCPQPAPAAMGCHPAPSGAAGGSELASGRGAALSDCCARDAAFEAALVFTRPIAPERTPGAGLALAPRAVSSPLVSLRVEAALPPAVPLFTLHRSLLI
ncbi:MAG TPA: hypothetical protein VMS86_05010 [Thermoanaerobaculia bacterium]|nr:hypothetical protein [Thermoanaerobaculia bacterium]